jgi:hypothetical protein
MGTPGRAFSFASRARLTARDLQRFPDEARAQRLEQQGYRIWTQTIAAGITTKARLLLGAPAD